MKIALRQWDDHWVQVFLGIAKPPFDMAQRAKLQSEVKVGGPIGVKRCVEPFAGIRFQLLHFIDD